MLNAITRTATITCDEHLLITELFDDLIVETEDALENFRIVQDFMQGKKYVSLVITAPGISITKEAREDSSHPERYVNCVAQAIVVSSLATRLLGNFMMRVLKSHCPQRLFQNKEDAIVWLNRQWELYVGKAAKSA